MCETDIFTGIDKLKYILCYQKKKKDRLHLSRFGRHCIDSVAVSNHPHHEYHVYHLQKKRNENKFE